MREQQHAEKAERHAAGSATTRTETNLGPRSLVALQTLRREHPEEWRKIVADHRERYGVAHRSRRAAYLQILDPQAKSGAPMGVPLGQ
jgi:hypothetical protein